MAGRTTFALGWVFRGSRVARKRVTARDRQDVPMQHHVHQDIGRTVGLLSGSWLSMRLRAQGWVGLFGRTRRSPRRLGLS